jgi:hypothetical protein
MGHSEFHGIEVSALPEKHDKQPNPIADLVSQARERLGQECRTHAEELDRLEQALQELRKRHTQLEVAIEEQLATLGRFEPPAPERDTSLEKLLSAVQNLITATLPEQVLDVLTEEAEQLGVRAAVFDVRGKAAWGASARGFGPSLSAKVFRGIAVPLNQDNPFRQAYETGGHVDLTGDQLKKNRNLFEKFKPNAGDCILLLPIRSAGSVSALFYGDSGASGKGLPVEALKILAEFAGAQLDRLMALGGGITAAPDEQESVQSEVADTEPEERAVSVASSAGGASAENSASTMSQEPSPPAAQAEVEPALPGIEAEPPAQEKIDISKLTEVDQKIHKDAQRFARLLVSEIELYNKAKVVDGRKNNDLYKRLKSDIDRSRHTYERRFGKTVAKQIDYLHEELVRTLAGSDAAHLGSEYPGPSA